MPRDWNLRDKKACVLGASGIAEAIRDALMQEGARSVDEHDMSADILVTVPDALHTAPAMQVDVSAEDWDGEMHRLFEQPRRVTHRLLPKMMERGFGRIVHVVGSFEPMSFSGEFAAWGAMAAWSKSLTRAVGAGGPTLNLIQAGLIAEGRAEDENGSCLSRIPAGRYCLPDDLAALVVFLCSPYARYLTGTVIPVDGGLRRYQN